MLKGFQGNNLGGSDQVFWEDLGLLSIQSREQPRLYSDKHFRVLFISLMNILCIACNKGYFGANCDIKCKLPWYGQNCQSLCWCKPQYCDHVNGCMQSSVGTNFDIIYMTYQMNQTRVFLMLFNSIICIFIVKIKGSIHE